MIKDGCSVLLQAIEFPLGHKATMSSHTASQPPSTMATPSHDRFLWPATTDKPELLQTQTPLIFCWAPSNPILKWMSWSPYKMCGYKMLKPNKKNDLEAIWAQIESPHQVNIWQKKGRIQNQEVKLSPLCSLERRNRNSTGCFLSEGQILLLSDVYITARHCSSTAVQDGGMTHTFTVPGV